MKARNHLYNQYREIPQDRRPMDSLDIANYNKFKRNNAIRKEFSVKLCTICGKVFEIVSFTSNNHIWYRLLYYDDFPTLSLIREDCPKCTPVDFQYKLGEKVSKK